jgi:hypothetical protein
MSAIAAPALLAALGGCAMTAGERAAAEMGAMEPPATTAGGIAQTTADSVEDEPQRMEGAVGQAASGSAAPSGTTTPTFPATAAGARAFVADAEARLARAGEFSNRAAWVRANFITTDTQWLETKAGGEFNELASRLAKDSARYTRVAAWTPTPHAS